MTYPNILGTYKPRIDGNLGIREIAEAVNQCRCVGVESDVYDLENALNELEQILGENLDAEGHLLHGYTSVYEIRSAEEVVLTAFEHVTITPKN